MSTPSISDAFDRLGIVGGVITGIRPVFSGAKVVGTAVTLRQVRTKMGEAGLARHEYVMEEIAKAGDVIVIDAGAVTEIATLGGNAAFGAKLRGIEGLITDGAIRDVEEIREMKFPVFASGFSPIRSSTRFETVSINETVQLGGTQVRPADIIVGDDEGIVSIPKEKVAEVLELAEKKEAYDRVVKSELEKGTPQREAYKKAHKATGW